MWIIWSHSSLSTSSFSFNPLLFTSSLMHSCHLLFGLPFLRLSSSDRRTLISTYPSPLLNTCSSHFSLVTLNFSLNFITSTDFLIYSFRIMSLLIFTIQISTSLFPQSPPISQFRFYTSQNNMSYHRLEQSSLQFCWYSFVTHHSRELIPCSPTVLNSPSHFSVSSFIALDG